MALATTIWEGVVFTVEGDGLYSFDGRSGHRIRMFQIDCSEGATLTVDDSKKKLLLGTKNRMFEYDPFLGEIIEHARLA